MTNKIIALRNELMSYRYEYKLLQKIPCSKQENKEYQKIAENSGTLPEGVFPYVYDNTPLVTDFYTIHKEDLTESEIEEYLAYKQLSLLKTIKSCVLFFTILTIILLIIVGIIIGRYAYRYYEIMRQLYYFR